MLIAGYDAMHEITSAYLRQTLPKNAWLLILGAGTCIEIIKLAKLESGWRFLALDSIARHAGYWLAKITARRGT